MTLIFILNYKLPEYNQELSIKGYIPLFKSKPLILLMINLVFMFAPYWIFVGISPLLYIKDLGVSLSHFGYYQGVLALVFALGSLLFGLVMHRYRQQQMLSVAGVMHVVSLISIGMVTMLNTANPLLITIAFIPFIISQIVPSSLLVPICMNFIPHAKGKISTVLQGSQLTFAALSLAIAGHFYQGLFRNAGIIIIGFILVIIVTHFLCLELMES